MNHARLPRRLRLAPITIAIAAWVTPQAQAASYDWLTGYFTDTGLPASLLAADVLAIGGGGTKYLNAGVSSLGKVTMTDSVYFQGGSTFSNLGLFEVQADVGFYDGGYGGTLLNTGTFLKSAGGGSATFAGAGFTNNGGVISVQAGTVNFSSGAFNFNNGTQFTGVGQSIVTGSASFAGSLAAGNLTLVSGTFTGAASVVSGALNWSGGTLAGDWTVASAQALNLQGGGTKYLAGTLTNKGVINATDTLYFTGGNLLANQGVYDLQGDVGMADGGYGGNFVNTGTLRKSAGSGSSSIGVNGSGFTNNGGTIDAQSGTINFNAGALTFNDGSSFTGAGQVVVSSSASFAGSLSGTNLNLSAGTFTGSGAVINGAPNWSGGILAGDWKLAAGQALNVQGGSTKYLSGTLTNQGRINATDTLYLTGGNLLANQGVYDLQGDVGLADGGYGGNVVNTGVLRKSAGTGTSYVGVNGVGFTNNGGTINAQVGTINFNSGALAFNHGTQFTGAGAVVVSGNANFAGSITGSNLNLAGATYTGNGAVVNGAFAWTGGTLAGDWTVAAGQVLNVQSGSYHYIGGTLSNQGRINLADSLYLSSNNSLFNQALLDLQGDVSIGDGGYGGNLVNTGTLRKSAGAGVSYIGFGGSGFSNNGGTIEAQVGTINFNSGALNFNAGTAFTGAGAVVVSGNAGFAGASSGSNITLSNATFTGSAAVINGNFSWTGGTLAGDWQVAAGKTLSVQAGGYHYIGGTLSNLGRINLSDSLYLSSNNSLFNQALLDLRGDVSIGDGGYGGNLVNTGTLRKSAGAGVSYIGFGGSGFSNNGGTIEAQVGTINFNSGALNFNDGTLFSGAGKVVASASAGFTGNVTSQNLQLASGTFTGGNGTPGSKGVFNGNTVWSGGTLAGSVELAATHTLTVQGGSTKYLNGSLNNKGSLNASDTVYLQSGNTLSNNGVYNLQGDVGLADGGYGGNVVNNGLLVKSAGSGSSDLGSVGLVNNGTVNVASGDIRLPSNFSNAGTLKGSGSFTTNLLINNGHVAPGNSPGTLTLNGSFAQTVLGSLDIELQSAASFDKLIVGGSAALDGTLALSCFGACNLAVGQTFTILDAAPNTLSGSFASITLAGFASGAFSVVYDLANGDVLLQVTQATTAAVPEPGGWALMLAGLGALGWVARQRSRATSR